MALPDIEGIFAKHNSEMQMAQYARYVTQHINFNKHTDPIMKPKYKVGQTVLVDGKEEKIIQVHDLNYFKDDCYWYKFEDDKASSSYKREDLLEPVYKVGDRVRIKTHEELMTTEGVLQAGCWYNIAKECLKTPKAASIHGTKDKKIGTEQEVEDITKHGSLVIGTNLYGQWMIAEWIGNEETKIKDTDEMNDATKTQEGWYFSTLHKELSHGDGRTIAPGVTHTVDGKITACVIGLHMFPSLDRDIKNNVTMEIHTSNTLILWRVEGSGDLHESSPKIAYRNRKYLWGVHVEGWNIDDYKVLNDCRSIEEVKRTFKTSFSARKSSTGSVEYFEAERTETIEVPYFEGYQLKGYRKAEVGEYYLDNDHLRKTAGGTCYSYPVYEKLAPPKPEVKYGQVWKFDGTREYILLVVEIYDKSVLLDLKANDSFLSGSRLYLLEKRIHDKGFELIADSLEEYYKNV